jgi:4-alpha-glucanotransferase
LSDPADLIALAERLGAAPSYLDMHGAPTQASDRALTAIVAALGSAEKSTSPLPPLQVRWTDQVEPLIVPAGVEASLIAEDGTRHALRPHENRAPLASDLAPGRYRVVAGEHKGWLLLAPRGTWRPAASDPSLGIFLPHHALQRDGDLGIGDLTALRRLGVGLVSAGARVLATLPLLPTFLHDAPYEPSPYASVSRLFWGEHLIDVTATAEWEACDNAHALLEQHHMDGAIDALREGDHWTPQGAWRLLRELLGALAQAAWEQPSRSAELRAWAAARPERLAYARFRAATEQHGPWPTWPLRDAGHGVPGVPVDEDRVSFWIYAQAEAERQVRALRDAIARTGGQLYLDLPIGVHPDGFDTWYWGDTAFARGVTAGAPPDLYFPSGQDWGFPPLHPRHSAEGDGLGYVIACLRAHTEMAHLLRLDHVMGFYRLFWIPSGMTAQDGVYVRYPADAWWAALCIASQEHQCAIVGENLGLVPPEIDGALVELAVRGMAVGQFQITSDPTRPIRPIPGGSVASLNTHDTPTFAGWWAGEDIASHLDLGWWSAEQAEHARRVREAQVEAVRTLQAQGALAGRDDLAEPVRVAAGLYATLARSRAHLVLVNLEDLWGETRPHNVPGTWRERPNWLRRASKTVEQILADPLVHQVLSAIARTS